ncbi:MAG: hypothetical protein FJ261_15525 [Planctomycetes bacterium]|nr:hypothetical protein [Planctomycetota bacterium]
MNRRSALRRQCGFGCDAQPESQTAVPLERLIQYDGVYLAAAAERSVYPVTYQPTAAAAPAP